MEGWWVWRKFGGSVGRLVVAGDESPGRWDFAVTVLRRGGIVGSSPAIDAFRRRVGGVVRGRKGQSRLGGTVVGLGWCWNVTRTITTARIGNSYLERVYKDYGTWEKGRVDFCYSGLKGEVIHGE